MMYPCKCGANNWDFVKLDNNPQIFCKCKSCGKSISFLIPKKACSFCFKPTDFERLDIDENHRGKKCLLCGEVKVMEKAKAEFRMVDGISYRLEDDELWHETEWRMVKGAAIQLMATNKVLVE